MYFKHVLQIKWKVYNVRNSDIYYELLNLNLPSVFDREEGFKRDPTPPRKESFIQKMMKKEYLKMILKIKDNRGFSTYIPYIKQKLQI